MHRKPTPQERRALDRLTDGLADLDLAPEERAEDCGPSGGCPCCWLADAFDLADTLAWREKQARRQRPAGLPIRLGLLGLVVVEV